MKRTLAIDYLLDRLSQDQGQRVPASSLSAADWSELVQLAGSYRVAPLLYRRIRSRQPEEAVPAGVEAALKRFYVASTVTNERLLHQLGRVLAALEREQIAAIVLKGAHLAALVYDQPALRPMTDVDLLVRETDVPAITGILSGLGYTRQEAGDAAGRTPSPHARYSRPDDKIALEVHWHIEKPDSPLQIDLDGLWARAERVEIAGAKTRVLCREDLLLHLCVHASLHHYLDCNGLRSLCDVAEVVGRYGEEFDWERFLRRARAWRAGRAVYLTLRMSVTLLSVPVPGAALSTLEPAELPAGIFAWAEEQLLTDPAAGAGDVSTNWGRLSSAPGLIRKLREAARVFLPPPAVLAAKYSAPPAAPFVYIYYPAYFAGLCRKHLRRAWRLLRGDRQSLAWLQRQQRRARRQEIGRWIALG